MYLPVGEPTRSSYERIEVESFFTETSDKALVAQVRWFQSCLHVNDDFFSDMLNLEGRTFSRWKYGEGYLSNDKQKLLNEFWEMLLHVMSFYDYDLTSVRELFQSEASRSSAVSPLDPPWTGTSLRNYLEKTGPSSIREANRWIQTLRYANWY